MYRLVALVGLVCSLCCRLLMVGFAVSLAGRDTFAERSTREFVESLVRDTLLPRNDVSSTGI